MSEADVPRPLPLQLTLLTFKEGLLARAAHDLRLHVDNCRGTVGPGNRVHVEIAADSIRVDGAMVHGVLQPDELTQGNRREIEENIREHVLHSARHPVIRFEGTFSVPTPPASHFAVEGELEICGVRRKLQTQARRNSGMLTVEFELKPSSFGIEPFRALMGAIRVADRIQITVETPEFEP